MQVDIVQLRMSFQNRNKQRTKPNHVSVNEGLPQNVMGGFNDLSTCGV